jgi:hypothetical protein
MLNPFFLQGSRTEQGLIQDLINETIQMHGVEIYYLPRQYVTKRTVVREVIESKFSTAFPIEAYVDTYEGYEGAGVLLSKFGIQPNNDLSLIISKERYENYITPLITNLPNVELPTRPKEGDLIWFPLGDRLFEIKFVEHEIPFYQLQNTYVYNLRCELFRYQDEIIATEIDNIDDNILDVGYVEVYNMVGVGSTATAITNIVNGGVRLVTVTNRGDGYSSAPIVGFSSSPSTRINATATGIAEMISGIVDLCEPDDTLLRVQAVQIVNPGYAYTIAPSVSFGGGGGAGAEATAYIGDGIVGIITVVSGGSGYSTTPNITFVGMSSITAQAFPIMSNGTISEIRIINAGIGYTMPPIVQISSPFSSGVGTYIFNEEVVGSASSMTARVKSWDAVTLKLRLSNPSGQFLPGELIVGEESGASYSILRESPIIITDDPEYDGIDKYPQNDEIQIAASTLLDFSESNPFGTP